MPTFSTKSKERLSGCDEGLQNVFNEVIKYFNCTIITGKRGQEEQDWMHETGRSQLKWPNSKHNVLYDDEFSDAVDVAPWPIDWKDRERFTFFAGFVLGMARKLGIKLRWGGDWDGDWEVRDNHFDDLCHFERIRP